MGAQAVRTNPASDEGPSPPRRSPKAKDLPHPVDPLADFSSNRNFVMSFARGLEVIQSFYNEAQGISAARVSRKTGLSRAAVRRLLMTLELLGYTEEADGVYHLKPAILRLASCYLTSKSLPSIAQPILEQISKQIQQSTSLSVLDGDSIIYIARCSGSRVLSVGLSVGSRLPAYCTSMGRVLLADLSEKDLLQRLSKAKLKRWTSKTVVGKAALVEIVQRVGEQRYALVDGELELGLRSLAVPIRNSSGRTVAAMNVGAHITSVSTEEMITRMLPVLKHHAELISGLL